MLKAPLPADEAERLRALRDLDVLDSAPEPAFDALAATAALVCGVPISLVSLVDDERQWFKAQVGLDGVGHTARDISFCGHAIMDDGLFVVPDTLADARFADNPLVLGQPDIRFYAGAPLRLSNGARIGTLCVIDRQPRELDAHQRAVMQQLSIAAVQALEFRRLARSHHSSEMRFRALSESAPLGVFATDAEGACVYTNERWCSIYGLTRDEALGDGWVRTLHPDDQAAVQATWQAAAAAQRTFDMAFRVQHPDGTVRHVRAVSRPTADPEGRVLSHVGSVEDITERMAREERLRKREQLLSSTGEMAQVGGWELELATGALMWTDQTCRIHGLPPGYRPQLAEAIDFYAPEARPVVEAAVRQAMVDGSGWDLELPFIQVSGRRIWVRAVGHAEFEGGKPVRMLGAIQDVTSQVQQRQRLAAMEQRVRLATESGGIGIWEQRLDTGEWIWDARMLALFGQPAHTATDPRELWARQVHPEDSGMLDVALQGARARGQQFEAAFRVRWPGGEVHHLQAAARVAEGGDGSGLRLLGVAWDVTALQTLNTRLADQHELLQVTLQSIGDAVITTDAQGVVTWLNPAAERMTGWSCEDALGLPLAQVFHILDEAARQAGATVLVSRHGVQFGIEDSAAPIRNAAGEVLGTVLVFRDVTEQRRLSGEMSYRATHDALTGLFNRTEFETRLQRTLQASREQDGAHALLYIDLDQFKLVNDACGHAVGDQLLQQVAGVLKQTVRSRDTLARLGGDEFAVLLEYCTVEQGLRVAQLICDRMEEFRFVRDERRFRVGASIGLVPVDSRWIDIAAVLQAADSACYTAKEAGRNRVHTWLDSDQALSARQGELRWATRLEQALDEDMFVLFAQRIVPLGPHREGLHAEVLVRLQERDGTLVSPGAFLPAVERFHMAGRLDRWVLRHALDWLQSLPDASAVDTLSVNLSGLSVGDRAFHHFAVEALKVAGHDLCRRLCLEITETAAVTRLADAARFIDQVRGLGVRIALDDFGAGASSFGYLKSLKVDVIKIDGSFIRDVVDDPLDDAAVRCFADVARVIGVQTVAEFVDRPEVLERVRAIGIDFAQGYLLHRPEPLSALCASAVQPVPS